MQDLRALAARLWANRRTGDTPLSLLTLWRQTNTTQPGELPALKVHLTELALACGWRLRGPDGVEGYFDTCADAANADVISSATVIEAWVDDAWVCAAPPDHVLAAWYRRGQDALDEDVRAGTNVPDPDLLSVLVHVGASDKLRAVRNAVIDGYLTNGRKHW